MAYRNHELMPVCADCNELATGHCARCARPLCQQHASLAFPSAAVAEETRCVECETEFLRRLQAAKTRTATAALLVTVVCGAVMVAAGPVFFRSVTYPAILNLFLVMPFGAWALRALAPAKTRRSFLKERVRQAALPEGATRKFLPAGSSEDC